MTRTGFLHGIKIFFFLCYTVVLSSSYYCMVLVFAFSPSICINLGTCRVKYSMWRWEINVFVKELETKLLKSRSTHCIFSSACSGCALEQGLDVVGRPRLPRGDQISPQRWLWASTCGEEPHYKNMWLFSHLSPRPSWVEEREELALVLLSLCSPHSNWWELQRQMSAWSWGVVRQMICLTDLQCKKAAGDRQFAPTERLCTKLKINASFTSKILSEAGFVLARSSPSRCSHGHLTAVCLCFHDIGHSTCHGETSIGHSTKMVFQLLFGKIMFVVWVSQLS